MTYACPHKTHTIPNYNVRSPRGNQCRKDHKVYKDQNYELVEYFTATGIATHGSKCIRVRDSQGHVLSDFLELWLIL
jgi:hypothetical protein